MLEDEIDASIQLQGELEDSIATAFSKRRPILTHLNADTTWLLSLPWPEGSTHPEGRQRFNILIDPWLTGPQSDVASWFSRQWHIIKSSVQSISELNNLLAAREASMSVSDSASNGKTTASFIDSVVISHEFTDHCHQATLEEVPRTVPVFATSKAAQLIRSWKHFENVFDAADFGRNTDWRTTSRAPLPSWLGIARLTTPGDALYYHSAIVICFQVADKAESVIYTPHGVEAASFSVMHSAEPFVENLALLHGLHDVSIWMTKQLNLGAFNAVDAARMLKCRYWVGTHDEIKKGGGLIAPFLRRKAWTMADIFSNESIKKSESNAAHPDKEKTPDPEYIDLRSGESLVLG